MSTSLSFDQAVPYYDKTRAYPEEVERAVTDSIIRVSGVAPRSRILEAGVGTGNIGLPLLARGYPIVGADLSIGMMAEIPKKLAVTPAVAPITLVRADAVQLPFGDETFDAVYAVRLFHVVAGWEQALEETRRVLKRGGALLVSYHVREADSPNKRIRHKLGELVARFGISTRRPGAQSDQEIRQAMERWGRVDVVPVAQWEESTRVATILDEIESKVYSDAWLVPSDVLARVVPELRAWAADQFQDIHRDVQQREQFVWLVARK